MLIRGLGMEIMIGGIEVLTIDQVREATRKGAVSS